MNVIILVVDGFGIGAMPDAGQLRRADSHADTLGSLVRWSLDSRCGRRQLAVPNLAALGLNLLRPELGLAAGKVNAVGLARKAALGYPGADSFAGHQTMMGADMSHVELCRLGERLEEVAAELSRHGYQVEKMAPNKPVLIVDGEMLVHDNLEADPGLNWNVSGRLDHVEFAAIVKVSRLVRAIAPVARIIAVGGYSDRPLTASTRPGVQGTFGMDTPATGFYRNGGLKVEHIGATVAYREQLPEIAAQAGIAVTLIGKAADLLATEAAVERLPGVETTKILGQVVDRAATKDRLIVANVQQTDLAGHQCDPEAWSNIVEQVDAAIGQVLTAQDPGDVLLVTGDHGNDPAIGHSFHTREYVPVLSASPAVQGVVKRGSDFNSLADVGASVAWRLGLSLHTQGRAHLLCP